jgi:hypothetical protein
METKSLQANKWGTNNARIDGPVTQSYSYRSRRIIIEHNGKLRLQQKLWNVKDAKAYKK